MLAILRTLANRILPRTPRWIVLWLLAPIVVAALVILGDRWRHPTVFPEAGGWGTGSRNFPVGVPLYVGMTYEQQGERGTVTIRDVHAHIVRNTSGATAEFFVCTIATRSDSGAIGSVSGDEIHDYCQTLVPATGARVELNAQPLQQVVMAVTNAHPGRVRIAGMDLSYSHSWQRGTQRTGGVIVLGSRPPGS